MAVIDDVGRGGRGRAVHGLPLRYVAAAVALLLAFAAGDAARAAGMVYRCETPSGIEYRDIGCGMTAPMRLGRPVGSIDPLTEGERALLEQLQRDMAARARSAGPARSAAASRRERACVPGQATACAEPPGTAKKARKRPRKPRTVEVAATAPRARMLGRRPGRETGASPRPPAVDAPAGPDAPAPARRLAPGR